MSTEIAILPQPKRRYSVVSPSRGGARQGAGRKKGGHNRRTEEAIAMAENAGCNPVEFLIKAMQDQSLPMKDRIDCAKAVAPYVAPRLSSVEARVTNSKTHEECLEELDD